MTILRTGATQAYSSNWDAAFGEKTAKKAGAKKTTAKKKSAKKKAAKKKKK